MDLIHFRMEVAEALITVGSVPSQKKRGRPSNEVSPTPVVPIKRQMQINPIQDVRFDNVGHLPEFQDVKNNGRCKNPGCNKKTFVQCVKCKVNLCVSRNDNCFLQFHTKSR